MTVPIFCGADGSGGGGAGSSLDLRIADWGEAGTDARAESGALIVTDTDGNLVVDGGSAGHEKDRPDGY